MTIQEKTHTTALIDLDGPDGNAFALMGVAKRLAPQLGLDPEKVIGEMQEGDYVDLLIAFDDIFGNVVNTTTGNEGLMDDINRRLHEREELGLPEISDALFSVRKNEGVST
jgi:hypothetical protein